MWFWLGDRRYPLSGPQRHYRNSRTLATYLQERGRDVVDTLPDEGPRGRGLLVDLGRVGQARARAGSQHQHGQHGQGCG